MTKYILKKSLAMAIFTCGISSLTLADSSVDIDVKNEIGTIRPEVYGQFAEHLGRGIYEGIWVGENSSIPNEDGYRSDVLAALKHLKVPVVRWPGGCFADEYNWRDGVGPREERPVRINNLWGGVEEDNSFGTHEFFNFAEKIGAKVYLAANVGSGTPREMMQWIEYISSDKNGSLANERRSNGRDEPWKIDFIGIGNESWGCGGNMTPEYFIGLYNQFATFARRPGVAHSTLVASGGQGDQTIWTDVISKNVIGGWVGGTDGISHHFYTRPTDRWDDNKGDATGFAENEWFSTFKHTMRVDGYLKANSAVLDKNNPEGNIGIYLDEWGIWTDPEVGSVPGFLYQQNSIRDAILAAINFNIFHTHTKRLHMANIAQMVNVLQAMILTDKEKMLLTPTYHAFEMYNVFQGASALAINVNADKYSYGGESLPNITATAARDINGDVWVALANLDPNDSEEVALNIEGGNFKQGVGRILTADTIDAHNTFDEPNRVKPAAFSTGLGKINVPAKALIVMKLQ